MSETDRRAALLRALLGELGTVLPDATSWERWVWMARLERVVPLLYHLVDQVPTDLADDQRNEASQVQGAVLARCVQLEHHAIAVTEALAARGIRSALLKGGATAHLDYPDPSQREFSDVDLLVDPADRLVATSVVEAAGWKQGYALPSGHERFTHAVTFVMGSMELDLHQRIAHRALGLLVPTRDLLDHAVPLEIAGARLFALDDVDRMIHASIHAAAARGAQRRLSSIADVLLAAEQRPHLACKVLTRAEGWRVRSLVERSVRDAYAAAQLAVPAEWEVAMRSPIRRRNRLVDRAYLPAVRRPVAEELAYLRLLGGWRQRWDYTRGYVAIGPDYASQHGRSGAWAQLRYVLAKLRSKLP